MNENIDQILSYLKRIHTKHADGCKSTCGEREVGYHCSDHYDSYWFVRFGGYCLGDLSRSEEVKADTIYELVTKLQTYIEDAIKRHQELEPK